MDRAESAPREIRHAGIRRSYSFRRGPAVPERFRRFACRSAGQDVEVHVPAGSELEKCLGLLRLLDVMLNPLDRSSSSVPGQVSSISCMPRDSTITSTP
jgi:hypothetical protein